jgi:hypothetical protein
MAVCNAESSLASVDEEEGRVVLFLLLFLLLLYRFMLPLKNLTEWDGTFFHHYRKKIKGDLEYLNLFENTVPPSPLKNSSSERT